MDAEDVPACCVLPDAAALLCTGESNGLKVYTKRREIYKGCKDVLHALRN